MNPVDPASMFILGLFGTGHCMGMCGPLVFAFPGVTGRFVPHLYYHLGRAFTYTTVGFLLGGLGSGISFIASRTGADPLAWTIRIQILFSILAAVFLLIFVLSRLQIVPEPRWMSVASPSRIPGFKDVCNSARRRKTDGRIFLIGILLGFLPCGLSYGAFARSLGAGGPVSGAILLSAFAAGTVPGLLLLGTSLSGLATKYRRYSDPIAGMIMIAMGGSLIVDAWGAIM